jgi:hypothetical protein
MSAAEGCGRTLCSLLVLSWGTDAPVSALLLTAAAAAGGTLQRLLLTAVPRDTYTAFSSWGT